MQQKLFLVHAKEKCGDSVAAMATVNVLEGLGIKSPLVARFALPFRPVLRLNQPPVK